MRETAPSRGRRRVGGGAHGVDCSRASGGRIASYVEGTLDPQFFYVMFIPTFTILAFMIGGMLALMAMTANANPGSDDGEGAEAH